MGRAAGARLNLGRVLFRSLRIWGRNIVPFTIVSALPYLPLAIVSALVGEPRRTSEEPADVLLSLVLGIGPVLFWLTAPAAVLDGVLRQLRGERVSIGHCIRVYRTRFLPVLGVAFVVGLVGFLFVQIYGAVPGALPDMGALSEALDGAAFVVGWAVTSCFFWVAVAVATIEKPGFLASLRGSVRLTRRAQGRVFVVSVLTLAFQVVPTAALSHFLGPKAGRLGEWAEILVMIVLGGLGAVASAVGYHDLRAARQGEIVEEAIRVFA